jgi:hypothetical protein
MTESSGSQASGGQSLSSPDDFDGSDNPRNLHCRWDRKLTSAQ